MVSSANPDWEQLMERASGGDRPAREQLLAGHRDRLRQMIAVRMDRRLVARIDPSDVVQDVLATATRNLSDYLRNRPMPFYPWLRKLAWERLIELQRTHLVARKRSVAREDFGIPELPDASAAVLAERLLSQDASPVDSADPRRDASAGPPGPRAAEAAGSRGSRSALPGAALPGRGGGGSGNQGGRRQDPPDARPGPAG